MVERERARSAWTGLVADAIDNGAEVLAGGSSDGLYFPPTVLRGVTPADAHLCPRSRSGRSSA